MPTRTYIQTDEAPKAIGPYSQGVALCHLVFLSGQIALVPETGELVKGSVTEETEQIFKNIGALLRAKDLTFENIVKATIFLTDMSKFAEVNAEYAKYFPTNPPARSCVGVASLPRGAQVEIEVIAGI